MLLVGEFDGCSNERMILCNECFEKNSNVR